MGADTDEMVSVNYMAIREDRTITSHSRALDMALAALSDTIDVFADELRPVLSEHYAEDGCEPKNCEPKNEVPVWSPIAGQLDGFVARVHAMTRFVNKLRQRFDV
jgi:hypothetical protein